ncbi:MAG: hypothetical protein ACI4V1_01005, partial [Eubacteriales bacterium]
NTAFLYYRFLGIVDNAAIPGKSETGYCLQSELSVLTLGEHTLALIPGEIFPELVCGGYLTDGAASPSAENPTPLSEIAANYGHTSLLICGLANDELGYIIPPNDFYLSEESPYFARGLDPSGRTHYEETNSVGAGTACRIAEAFEAALRALADEGEKK